METGDKFQMLLGLYMESVMDAATYHECMDDEWLGTYYSESLSMTDDLLEALGENGYSQFKFDVQRLHEYRWGAVNQYKNT